MFLGGVGEEEVGSIGIGVGRGRGRGKSFLRVIACSIVDAGNLLCRGCKLRSARGGGALD